MIFFRSPSIAAWLVLMGAGLTECRISAQSYTWNQAGSANWSVASWLGGTPTTGGGPAVTLNFNGSSTYSATDDLVSAFFLNQLAFNGAGAGTTITVATSASSSIVFGGTAPALVIASTNIANVTISATTSFSTSTAFTNDGTGLLTYSGSITAGANAITFSGTGSINVTGPMTFTGPGSIVDNTSSSASTTLGAVTLSGGASLSLTNQNTSATLTIGTIAANGNPIAVSGAGGTTIGTLTFGSMISSLTVASGTGPVSIGNVTVGSAGLNTFTNNSSNTLAITGTLTGGNPLVVDGTGVTSVTGNTKTGGYSFLQNSGAGLTLNTVTLSGSTTFSNAGSGALTIGGLMTGNESLLFMGTGAVNINGGTTITANETYTNANTGATTFSTGAIAIGGSTLTLANYSTAPLTIDSGITGTAGALSITGPGAVTINGQVATGTGGITLNNATGTLALSNSNSFSGNVVLTAGTLQFSSYGNLGTGAAAGAVTLGGGTLSLVAAAGSGTIGPSGTPGLTISASSGINVANSGVTLYIPGAVAILGTTTVTVSGAGSVSIGGAATIAATTTFSNNGGGGLTFGSITSATNQSLVFGGTGNTTVGGAISIGSGSLTLNGNALSAIGAGTLTLSSANAYTSATTVNAGTLIGQTFASGGPFGTGSAVAVNSGALQLNPGGGSTASIASLAIGGSAFVTINATGSSTNTTLAVTGALTRSGTGTVVFSVGGGSLGTNASFTFGSGVTPANGIISPWAVGQLSGTTNADFLNSSGGALSIASYNSFAGSGTANNKVYTAASGTTVTVAESAYALQVQSGVTIGGSVALTIGSGSGQAGLILNGTAASPSAIATTTLAFSAAEGLAYVGDSSAANSNTISSNITGSGGLTIFGPGSLTLGGSNTGETGTLTINGSNVTITAAADLNGATGGAMTIRGGTLNINGSGAFATTEAITTGTSGGGVINVNNPGAATTISGNLTLNSPLSLVTTNNTALTLSGTVGLFAQPLTLAGAGNVLLTNHVTATANTSPGIIMNGTGAVTFSPTLSNTQGLTVNSGTVVLNGTATLAAVGALTINGGVVKFGTSGGLQVSTGFTTLNGGTLDMNGFDGTIGTLTTTSSLSGGIVTNSASSGMATLTLNTNGANAFTFGGSIQDGPNGGTVAVTFSATSSKAITLTGANTYSGPTTVLSDAVGITIANPNALLNSTIVSQLFTTEMITFATSFSSSGGPPNPTQATIGGLSGIAQVVLPGTFFNFMIGNNNQSTEYSGVMSGGSSLVTFTKIGTGTLTLGNVNTYTGQTVVSGGDLISQVAGAVPFTTDLTVAAGATFDTSSLSQTVVSLAGGGTVIAGDDPTAVFTVAGAGAAITSFSGSITGSAGFSLTGTATQILSGTNTYTGATTVTGGTLQLDFSGASDSNIISSKSALVLGGGTLLITASTTPGSVANQTFNGLTLSANSASNLTLANSVAGTTLNVQLGSITRQAGTYVNITVSPIGTNTLSTSSGTPGGILTDGNGTAYASFNGNDWATVNNSQQIVGGSSIAGFYTLDAFSAGANVQITGSGFTAPSTATTINSLLDIGPAATLTLTPGVVYTISTGGILKGQSATGTLSLGSAAGQGNLQSASGEFVIASYGALTINANIQDNGAGNHTSVTLAPLAGATITLAGANTYSGQTLISTGAVTLTGTIANTSAILNDGTSFFTIKSAAGFTLNASITGKSSLSNTGAGAVVLNGNINQSSISQTGSSLTINGVISGSDSLGNGAGNLTLGNANTFTGATSISGGSLTVANALALQDSTVSVNSALGLQFASSITAATLGNLSGTAAGTIALTANGSGNSVALTVGGNNTAATYAAVMSGAGGLIKAGTATLTLTGLNTYVGPTTVGNGGLTLSFGAATGTINGILYNGSGSPGALTLGGLSIAVIPSALSVASTLTITASTGASSISNQSFGGLTLAANSNDVLTLTNSTASAQLNVSLGAISRSSLGAGSTPNSNTGSVLSVTETGTGTTTFTTSTGTAGAILTDAAGTAYAVINGNDWAAISTSGGKIVGLSTVGGYTTNTFGVGLNTDVTTSFSANANTTNSIRLNAAIATITLAAGTTTIATGGILLGSGATGRLTISGPAGSTLVSGSNEFVISANVNQGVTIGNAATPNGAVLADNGSVPTALTVSGNTSFFIYGIPTFTGPTTILGAGGLFFVFSGGTAAAPLVYSTSAINNYGYVQFGAVSGFQVMNAPISGTGNLNMDGGGTTVLGAQNTYTGNTNINGGVLQLGVNNALPIGTSLTMTTGTLNLNGFSQSLGALSGTNSAPIIQGGTGTSVLTVGSLNTNMTFLGVIQDGGGQVSLVKVGSGLLELDGANTYSGGTTILGGLVKVNNTTGSGTGTGNVMVGTASANTGTLRGAGTIGGSVVVNSGGTVSPGNSPGTLTINGGLTLAGVYNFELTNAGTAGAGINSGGSSVGADHDVIIVSGNVNLANTIVNISSLGSTTFNAVQNYSWNILTTSGTITSTSGMTLGTISGADFGSGTGTFFLGADTRASCN